MTKLKELVSALLETGWLVTAIIAVLFLNPFSQRVFELPKNSLFRCLVSLLFVALVIHELEAHEHLGEIPTRFRQAMSQTPFVGIVLTLILVHILATLLSMSPQLSFWGSRMRAQGTYTWLGFGIFFLIILRVLRRQDQLERFITTLLAISFPVALYGVIQHFGITLLQFTGTTIVVPERVISTIGNAIFIAAYLTMVVPLTLWRLMRTLREWPADHSLELAFGVGLYTVLLALQLLCMLYTQSRGPILALVVALFFMFFLLALLYDQRWWAWGTLAGGLSAFLFLLALNVSALPLDGLRQLPYLSRFSQLTTEMGSGVLFKRSLAWETVLDAVVASPLRLLLGYGPETMSVLFDRFVVAEAPWLSFDRAHNVLFDMLFDTGVVGAVAYLLLFGLIFYRVSCWLGLAVMRRERWLLSGLMLFGVGLGLLVPLAIRGDLAFAAVGVPAGMLLGLFVYLVDRLVQRSMITLPADLFDPILLVALLAATIGHYVESLTGLGDFSSRFHLWLYLALMILLGQRQVEEKGEEAVQHKAEPLSKIDLESEALSSSDDDVAARTGELGPLVAMSFIVSVILACLIFALVHGFGRPGALRWALGLVAATWVFNGALILYEHRRTCRATPRLRRDMAAYALTTLVWTMPFLVYHAVRMQTVRVFDEGLIVFVLWLLLTMVVAAVAWRWRQLTSLNFKFARGMRMVVYPVLVGLGLSSAWISGVNPMRADVYVKMGQTAIRANHWEFGLDSLRRAVHLHPSHAEYYELLGDAYRRYPDLPSDPTERDAWLESARQAFAAGWAREPNDSVYPRKIGELYQLWAAFASDTAVRSQRLEESLRYYLAAVELSPRDLETQVKVAGLYLTLGYKDEALVHYQRVVGLSGKEYLAAAYRHIGDIHAGRGETTEAIEAYRHAIQQDPKDMDIRRSLAFLYVGLGRRDLAVEELERALDMATGEEHAGLERLIATLEER